MEFVKCSKCGKEIPYNSTSCSYCGANANSITRYNVISKSDFFEKKIASPVTIVGCAMLVLSFFLFDLLSVGSIVCGIIDLAQNKKEYRHIGAFICIIIGVIKSYLWYEMIAEFYMW